jgi:hypothetical protein
MKLISLNEVVPDMEHAPHRIYMMEFDHSRGELFMFNQNPVGFLREFEDFNDVDDKTTLNIFGVEGDKQGRDHDKISRTHALVSDLRPLGIYILFWAKAETPEGLRTALQHPLMSRFRGLVD